MMVIILLVGTFLNVLNQTVLATAFPNLMKSFSINASTVQWLTTGFLLVNGIMIPLSAWLSTRFNTKWLWISAMTVFTIGTIMCWAAPTFAILLAGRLIQAVGVGVAMPLLQTIMFSIFPPAQRGSAMGLVGIAVGVGPAVGPTLSGWVIDNGTWHDIFGIMIPIALLIVIASFFFMRPVIENHKTHLDFLSLIMSSIGFGSLLYGFSMVGQDGWSSTTVITSLIIGVLVIAIFAYRQLHLKEPFLELRVFKYGQFTVASLLGAIANTAMTGAELVLPMYLQIAKGQSALISGLTLFPGAIVIAIMNPITGKIVDRFGGRELSIAGLFFLTLGTIPLCFLTLNTSLWWIILVYSIRMLGVSMVLMPITTVGMNALNRSLIAHGTAVNNTVKQIFSSIGTALVVSIMANVTKNHMPNPAHYLAQPQLLHHLTMLANLDGYKAAFLATTIMSVIGFLIAFLVKRPNKEA
ncbi:MDR family MFS transporter [Pediococcus damnosus]|nr:MDR family MFS transporter [Pediococcus damnosus]